MKAILNIKKQPWTCWVSEQPSSEEYRVEVEKGDKLDHVNDMGVSVFVEEIFEDQLLLVTNGLAPREEGAGIDLSGNFINFQVKIMQGASAAFSTQTMDAGCTYTLSLTEIVS